MHAVKCVWFWCVCVCVVLRWYVCVRVVLGVVSVLV